MTNIEEDMGGYGGHDGMTRMHPIDGHLSTTHTTDHATSHDEKKSVSEEDADPTTTERSRKVELKNKWSLRNAGSIRAR